MVRTIKVHIFGRNGRETKDMTLEEANATLRETFADSMGGLAIDGRTGQVISEIGPDVDEVFITHLMTGG